VTGSNGNDLSPGDSTSPGLRILGPDVAPRAAANLALRYVWPAVRDVVEGPGKVYSGELQPSMTPGPNELSIPEYAQALTGLGLGTGALLSGGAVDLASPGQFGAWHGTGISKPFSEFSNEALLTGQGHASFGVGHYFGQAEGTGKDYRRMLAGQENSPLNEDGTPLNYDQMLEKFFEPGSIVPSYGGSYDKVLSFHPNEYDEDGNLLLGGGWSTRVQKAFPRVDLAYNQDEARRLGLPQEVINQLDFLARTGGDLRLGDRGMLLNYPQAWETAKAPGSSGFGAIREHSTFPDQREVDQVGAARGWTMGQPGALIHVNIKPDEDEFLDWDQPWHRQSPVVQERLTNAGLDPESVARSITPDYDESITGGRAVPFEESDPTGGELYKQIANNYRMNSSDPMKYEFNAPYRYASGVLSDAGIAGNKYLDALSRDNAPILEHDNNWIGAPGGYAGGAAFSPIKVYSGDLDTGVRSLTYSLRHRADQQEIQLEIDADHGIEITPQMERRAEVMRKQLNDQADWVEQQHKEGHFSLNDTRTRNFVVFDPKDIEMKTWNGIPVKSLGEGEDPFSGGAP
jgi:hypothetical protein